jgi:hypothetical protein
MRWFRRWYGANPLHLLTMLGCILLADYAAVGLLKVKPVGVLIWFIGAVVGHDLVLLPLYVLADKSVMAVFRHRPPKLPTVPWINYLRVPVVLSGLLLLMWFPLIFRIPSHFPRTTDLSLDPYLGHWLAVTGVLFLLSAFALAVRLGVRAGRGSREAPGNGEDFPDVGLPQPVAAGYPEQPWYPEQPPWYPEQPQYPEQPRYPEQPWYPEEPRYPERGRYPEQAPRYPEQPRYPAQPPRYREQPDYPQAPRYPQQPPYPGRPRHARNQPNSAPPSYWDRDA